MNIALGIQEMPPWCHLRSEEPVKSILQFYDGKDPLELQPHNRSWNEFALGLAGWTLKKIQ